MTLTELSVRAFIACISYARKATFHLFIYLISGHFIRFACQIYVYLWPSNKHLSLSNYQLSITGKMHKNNQQQII